VALDDFGAGYSSFGYLRELPVDFIKLDGRLVRDIDRDPVKAAIVTAAITVAHAMGMRTIGEYVENAAIAERLTGCGADFGQGYHYGRPEPQSWPVRSEQTTKADHEGSARVSFFGGPLPDLT
jgi:EAL domain-containing protein (putative c-di-GMP-specific phosphodiesterase class I)